MTHLNPDLDALASVWLIKRFLPGWSKARVEFVPPGDTFGGKPAEGDPEVMHCDTGGGKFDHHGTADDLCAATLIAKEVFCENEKLEDLHKKAIERMLVVVNEDDHAKFFAWPEPTSDRWDFFFGQASGGMVGNLQDDLAKVIEVSLVVLDGIYRIFLEKLEAEGILECGTKFRTKWGKGIAAQTENGEFHKLALKSGFAVVVQLRPKSDHLGIYGNWQKGVNFKKVFLKLKELDSEADWFLHASGCIVLNSSRKNPTRKPTKLGLEEVIKILWKEL